ncbi:hypothetical protein JRQ81_000994 [Phrynocephalus forsythii]|uniref:RRM domain-containing protein n=1 Tax=Phrynocephalus forsythii TaxID=171643 RepID=A0A9Q1B8L6_9SAUR|nr:hypothetical protein JRQ81_000994 [Phrynocephalus forsythii]
MAAGGASRKTFEAFVHRIPWTVARDEIKTYFAQFGPVKKCIMPLNKETGFYKGICWVSFFNEESLTNALQKESHILEGVKVRDSIPYILSSLLSFK